jgi:hypothetical protein
MVYGADKLPGRADLLDGLKNHSNIYQSPFVRRRESDELRLMHVWSTRTCFSFPSEHAPFLRDRVGKQALDCDFLMGALLAPTSLHLAAETNDISSTRELVTAALEHQNRAIAGLKQNLQDLSPGNCDDVFLTTVLMMVCAFVQSILPLERYGPAKSAADVMVDAFKFLEGAQLVGISCFAWLFQGRALELFGNKTDETKEKRTKLDISAPIHGLRRLNRNDSPQASQIVLDDAISKLEKGFNGEIEEVAWLLSAGPEYIKLLREGDIVAMVVLMHYGVLLARRDDIWWLATQVGKWWMICQ